MTEVYNRLAEHLDRLPAGYPPTDSGVELRILRRLFTPREAEIALHMTLMPESAEQVAEKAGEDPEEMAEILEKMARKGLVFRMRKEEGPARYMAAQFVIGIWEYHVNDLDEELIRDFNEYVPHLMKKSWEKTETKQLRVIPVAESISAPMTVMDYEAAGAIIDAQSKIVVAPCICRREHEMVGEGCGKPLETCLVFGTGGRFYEENGLGRAISPEEARTILENAARNGLVLQPGNSRKPMNICMCCGDCCQILKNLNSLEAPARVVASNFSAATDPERCTGCGACADICQMGAVDLSETAEIIEHRCIGCGLCVTACDFEAVRLVEKEPEARRVPPANTMETYINIARERGLP